VALHVWLVSNNGPVGLQQSDLEDQQRCRSRLGSLAMVGH
jgi:hypothetical protein